MNSVDLRKAFALSRIDSMLVISTFGKYFLATSKYVESRTNAILLNQKDENLSRGSLTIAMLQIAIPSERKLLSTIYFRAISLSLWTSHHLSK